LIIRWEIQEKLSDILRIVWPLEEALAEESVSNYTAHILFPKNQYWEEGVDRALERFRAEMATQHSLVTKTIITARSTSVIKASDILEWSRLFAESDVLPDGEELAWEYCRRVSLCSEAELKNMLGGNMHALDNITHLGKLVACGHCAGFPQRSGEGYLFSHHGWFRWRAFPADAA
jgi:hypothetical protein